MYCERCSRIVEEEEKCPHCKNRHLRQPLPNDPCLVAELNYLSTGILEDILTQNHIPFLTKARLGAGLSVKIGAMFEHNRFYVPYLHLKEAEEIVDDLFSSDPDPASPAESET